MKQLVNVTLILFIPIYTFAQEVKVYKLNENLRLEILEVPFSKDHKISDCPQYPKAVCLIDDQIPFGTDLNLPSYEFSYIKLFVKDKAYILDSSNMFNAWGDRPLKIEDGPPYFIAYCENEYSCNARGMFSDGAGSFVAEWQIRFGVSQRTILTNMDDIFFAFDKSMSSKNED